MALKDNLISVWHMNNDAFVDSMGSNDGSAVGAGFDAVNKKFGSHAGNFEGINDYVRVLDDPTLAIGNSDLTISIWFRSTGSTGSNQGIFAKGNWVLVPNYQLFLLNAGSLQVVVGKLGVDGVNIVSAGSSYLADNAWHNLILWFDNANLRMYIDGVEDSNSPVSASGVGSLANSWDLSIGVQLTTPGPPGNPGNSYFKGQLDEIAIWDRALTSGEIAEIQTGEIETVTGIVPFRRRMEGY